MFAFSGFIYEERFVEKKTTEQLQQHVIRLQKR